jgi:LysR family nitrogen assimilation transcriptional regulator
VELKQLEYFVRVAELGGFTKAAAELSLTQPVLSKHVRMLEVELHLNLLVRNGRGVSLTEEGTMLLAHAKGILEQTERARQELKDIKGSPTGKVMMGSSAAAGTSVMAKLFAAFKERFPRASLDIIEIKGSSIYEWVLLGRLDIGILYDPPPSPSIDITPLREDELFLVSPARSAILPKSRKITIAQLGQYPLILPGVSRYIGTLLQSAAVKAGTRLNIALQVDGVPLVLELVHQGYGHTVFPKHIVQESNLAKKLQINSLVQPRLTRTLALAVSSQRRITYLTQETVKLIQHHFDRSGLNQVRNTKSL